MGISWRHSLKEQSKRNKWIKAMILWLNSIRMPWVKTTFRLIKKIQNQRLMRIRKTKFQRIRKTKFQRIQRNKKSTKRKS